MGRRPIAIGALVAMVGGFAITKLAEALDLGSGVVAVAFGCLVVGLLLITLGRQPRAAGPADRHR